jgi:short-subunit dehydrogenase
VNFTSEAGIMKKAIVIGASSGIGRELALILSRNGYTVGATGRRTDLLESLQSQLPSSSLVREMDVSNPSEAIDIFKAIISALNGVDLVIVSAGTGFLDPDLSWSKDMQTIDVNVTGFTAIANTAYHQFSQQGFGHLVGISSLAAIRGGGDAPAYNASKAFVSSYLQGLRQKIAKLGTPICVTDIRPGFVDTAMAQGEGLFWVQSPQKAARQIYKAIQKKRKVAYITKRWRLVAWIMKVLPDVIYHKI